MIQELVRQGWCAERAGRTNGALGLMLIERAHNVGHGSLPQLLALFPLLSRVTICEIAEFIPPLLALTGVSMMSVAVARISFSFRRINLASYGAVRRRPLIDECEPRRCAPRSCGQEEESA